MVNSNNNNNEFIKGHWNKINIKNRKKITSNYDKIKDWKMDPNGYFLIGVDTEDKLLRVGYCKILKQKNSPSHEMITEIIGKSAIEIINTLIREKFISSLQHAGDMGIELCKAELALKHNLEYIQDKDLKLK